MIVSPFSTLFLAIQAKLKAEVPELRFIEQDMGHLEMPQPPVSFPCALIDFADWTYETAGENLQFATGTVSIRLAIEAWSSTNNLAPSTWREKGLSFYDTEWKVYKCLQSWKPEKYGHLVRETVSSEDREDNLRVRLIRFSCNFEDMNAVPEYATAALPPPDFIEPPSPTAPSSPFKVRIPKR